MLAVLPEVADNSAVDQEIPTSVPGGESALDDVRETYLKLLLHRLEGGQLEAYEYTCRVQAVERATSADRMADIVDAVPSLEPLLDPVDLLRLARAAGPTPVRDRQRRYVALVLVAVFFIVVLALGMWLVTHVHQLHKSGSAGAADHSAQVSPSPPPLSVRSSRR
ncbi:MAG: hypothetical protein ACYDB3_02805 [Acidimicrobiales bacterium]